MSFVASRLRCFTLRPKRRDGTDLSVAHRVAAAPLRWMLAAVLVVGVAALPAAAQADEGDRVALVIGNGAYTHLPVLENPINDARDMAALLWQAGFETIELIDANHEEMLAGLATFAKRLTTGTDAVFYYAGHGVQNRGANFLLPTDTKVEDAIDLANHGIDANEIAALMGVSKARINVLILDACRDNPFLDMADTISLADKLADVDELFAAASPNTDVIVRSAGGLAPLQTTRAETIVGYATGPGDVALDGRADNSPYTDALLEHMNTPGLEIDMMFRRVRATVREETDGFQIPWVASTLENAFYIRPVVQSNVAGLSEALQQRTEDTRKLGMAAPDRLIDEALWRVVSQEDTVTGYEGYLQRYPNGSFAGPARQRIAELGTASASPPIVASAIDDDGTLEAYLGVGPIHVDLPEDIAITRGVPAFEVLSAPTSGTFFRPDETPINEGHLLTMEDLGSLTYLPRVDSKAVGITEYLEVAPRGAADAAQPFRLPVSSEIHPCDLLAGFRHAPDRVWDGVQLQILRLDPEPAVEACEQAVAEYPSVDRFISILSRAYEAVGDYERSRQMAVKAMERNYPPAFAQLGTLYMKGLGVPVDFDRALELFRLSDAMDNPAAPLRIGQLYAAGWGVEQDYAEALRWFQRSADLGNSYATTRIARLYLEGKGVPVDVDRALELLIEAAEAGELPAQMNLARLYRSGSVIPQDLDESLRWARAAAGAGMPTGQKALGQYYLSLPAPERDVEAAYFWLTRADENGDAWAPAYLAELHLDPEWRGRQPQVALDYLLRAVERGNMDAARDVAKLHEGGELQDSWLAASWHRAAAEAGNIWSMRDYGRALLDGEGARIDQAAGIAWLERSAAGGNPWAQRDLGRIFLRGDVGPADPRRAARYLALASMSADQNAVASASELWERVSSRDRVAAAQSLLGELGYPAGVPDGLVGPQTMTALADAGGDLGLPLEDPAAASTIAALFSALLSADAVSASDAELDDEALGVD